MSFGTLRSTNRPGPTPSHEGIKLDRSGLPWARRGGALVAFDPGTGRIARRVEITAQRKDPHWSFAFAGDSRIYVLRDHDDARTEIVIVE